ncbi:MAG: S-layer homology domain-containing protein, partial [Clostridiales bacterium]|nr:S-layer homology domain-containing protein [Clostridiales bacterium]
MKWIEKTAGLILTALLLLQPAAAFAADTATDAKQTDETAAGLITLLSDLDVIRGLGQIDADGEVTRGQFVFAVISAVGFTEILPPSGDAPFIDVPKTHTAERHITLAANAGLISGDGDGYFYPERTITLAEAVKITVIALGYRVNAEGGGGYPTGYLQTARSLQLIGAQSASGGMTWADSVNLLYRFISTDTQEGVSFGERVKYAASGRGTVLERNRGILCAEGVINAGGGLRLTDGAEPQEGRVELDGVLYFAGGTNAEHLVGHRVKAYYLDEDTDIRAITALYVKPGQNTVLELSADDIRRYDSDTRAYSYAVEDVSAYQRALISPSADVLYNNLPAAKSVNYVPRNGKVTLVDHDKDELYDAVFIEDYKTMIVGFVSLLDEVIYDKITGLPYSVEPDVNRSVKIKNADGANVALNALAEWNVLSVAEGENGGKQAVWITVSDKNAAVEIEEVQSGFTAVVTDGGEYKFSEAYRLAHQDGATPPDVMPALAAGDSATLYFDCTGKIAGANLRQTSDGAFAYLLKTQISKGLNAQLELKMFDGLEQKFVVMKAVSKRLTIDGVKVGDPNDALARLAAAHADFMTQLHSAAGGAAITDGYSQPIYYTFDDEGILSIDTMSAGDGGTDDGLRLIAPPQKMYYKSNTKSFSNKLLMDGNTFILSLPGRDGFPSDDIAEAKENQFSKSAATVFTNAKSYTISGYTRKKDSPVAELLITSEGGGSTLNNDTYISVIAKVSEAVSTDGETSAKLRLISFNQDLQAVFNSPELARH